MANYIKIPFAINPPRSFVAGALNGTATGGGTVSGTGASAAQAIVGGSGSGATATVTKGGDATIATATITIVATGEGYKVGDVVTIEALTSGGATQWTEDISYTVQADDLIDSEGSTTNEYYLVDVDTIMTVDYNFSVANQMRIWVNELTGGSTPARISLDFDDTPATNDGKLGQDLSEAIIKAIEAPNSVPTVEFQDGVELLAINLT